MPADKAGTVAPDPKATMTDGAQAPQQGATSSEQRASSTKQGANQQTPPAKSKSASLMDHLNIPAEIQKQIAPKESPTPNSDLQAPGSEAPGGEEPQAEPSDEDQRTEVSGQQDVTEETEVADQLPEEEIEAPQGRKLTKEQKRINKLVRQRNEAERAAESAAAENAQWREHFARQQQSQADANAVPVPGATGPLARVATEAQLNGEVARAKAVREFCDANPEGVTYTKDGKQEFADSQEVARWARESDKIIADAPERRDQIRGFSQAQQVYNQTAYSVCPQLFDRNTEEHQLAVSLLGELPPQARSHPGINLFLADWVRGFQSRQAEQKTSNTQRSTSNGGNGNGKRAIDDRAFAPRVPLAPHTDITTSRGSGPSPQKKVDAAKQELVDDPDGGRDSLKRFFDAQDATGNRRRDGRAPATV